MFIFLIVAAVLALVFVSFYNSLVKLKNKCEEAWSSINIQLKRRFDLVPNLVETVKGYATHEKSTFEAVIQARNGVSQVSAGDVAGQAQAQAQLSQAVRQIMVLAESYPQLRANENFMSLQSSLTEIESDIQNARRYYNGVTRDFNTALETFPSVIIARLLNYSKKDYFELESADEAKAVQVKF